METQTITRIRLVASDGMMLTNGTDYGKLFYLANSASVESYYEIPEEEAIMLQQKAMEESIAAREAERNKEE